MRRVTKVESKPGYILLVTFDDGIYGEVSMVGQLFGTMFEPLKDPEYFAQASVNEFGAVCWPNDVDLAPDAMYCEIIARKQGFE